MKIKYSMPIELYIKAVINEDRDASKITETWNLEKDEIMEVLVDHFQSLGIFKVLPMQHAKIIYENVIFQLHNSPILLDKIEKVNESIRKLKERHSRRHG